MYHYSRHTSCRSVVGYKLCARIYLNGDGMGKTTHVSLFFVIMRGQFDALLKWPFRQKVGFSPFAAVSLCSVAGLADTFPSFPVSGPFLPDVPGFQVPPDSIFPPQLRSSSRALPLHLHFSNCSDVLGFVSSFHVPAPFQPSTSHDHRYRFHPCFRQDLLISLVFQQAHPIAPFLSLLLPYEGMYV